jgi:hypothetical protein
MNDIVERLRTWQLSKSITVLCEAADEIGRLRAENKRLHDEVLAVHIIMTRYSDGNKELEAEKAELLAALKAQLDAWDKIPDAHMTALRMFEIARAAITKAGKP